MPTVESVMSSRVTLAFIGLILGLPGLEGGFGGHFFVLLDGLRALETRKPT